MNNVDCIGCHQLGQESTRTIPGAFGEFKSGEEAWMRRVSSGQTGEWMTNRLAGQLGGVPFKYFGDWTDRVAKGELPKSKPPRPTGIERNVVISSWEWATEKHFVHDLISSDRRYPTVNAYGPLYGANEYSSDDMPILDPKTHKVTFSKCRSPIPMRRSRSARRSMARPCSIRSAPRPIGAKRRSGAPRQQSQQHVRQEGPRVAGGGGARHRKSGLLPEGSDHPSAKAFPLERSGRQVTVFDPKTQKYSFIDTCFGTHHPQFGYDADDTLWVSGTGPVAGWVNTKLWDETGDAVKAQGLGAVRSRHQRQRQGRRIHRAGQAGRGGQGHAVAGSAPTP
jgi:hypothetical protein